jgi:hypothetical protein
LPWVKLCKIFKHTCDNGKETLWVLVQKFLWLEDNSPIDARVSAPHVVLADEENCNSPFLLLRPSEITHQVQLLVDEVLSDGTKSYWINWWLSIGPHKYPFQHFDELQQMDGLFNN